MPRPREHQKKEHFSRWAALTVFHMERLSIANSELASIVKVSEFNVHSFLTGRTKPPLDLADKIADALRLTGNERESYVLEAHMAHATPELRDYVAKLRRQVTELSVTAAKKPASPAG